MKPELTILEDERLRPDQNLFDQPAFEQLTLLGVNRNALLEVRQTSLALARQFITTLKQYHLEDYPDEPINLTHILWTDRENVDLAYKGLYTNLQKGRRRKVI